MPPWMGIAARHMARVHMDVDRSRQVCLHAPLSVRPSERGAGDGGPVWPRASVQTFDASGCDDEVRYRCYTHGSAHTGRTSSDCDEIKEESYLATHGSLHKDGPVIPSGSGADAHVPIPGAPAPG